MSEHDWLHFERLLKGHAVPAAAQEPGYGQRGTAAFDHLSTEDLADELGTTVNRTSGGPLGGDHASLAHIAKIGLGVALASLVLAIFGVALNGGSGESMSAALAGSVTSRVALNSVTQADIDRTSVTVSAADLPDVLRRAAGIGVVLTCDNGVPLGTGPALAPSNTAKDWTTCVGELGSYQLSVVPAGAETVQVVIEPVAKDTAGAL